MTSAPTAKLAAAAALAAAAGLSVRSARAQSVSTASIPATARSEDEFGVYGSATIGEALMPALIERYAETQNAELDETPGPYRSAAVYTLTGGAGGPSSTVHLRRRGSQSAFSGLASGSADLGMSSRPVTDAEAAIVQDTSGVDLRDPSSEHVLALDGLAIIVHPENRVRPLSLAQTADLFSGAIRDWSELGQPPGKVRVHARDRVSGDQAAFENMVMRPADAILRAFATRHGVGDDLVAAVASDRSAIGFAPLGRAKRVRAMPLVLSCGKIVSPTPFAIKAEEYPLGRRLYLYTRGRPTAPDAAGLLDFALSDEVQPLIRNAGFVDQSLLLQSRLDFSDNLIFALQAAQGPGEIQATRRFAETTRALTRLSTTFRFRTGGNRLDAKAVADAGRLARWLEIDRNAGAAVTLAGFSDARGGYRGNLALSRSRAEAIRRAILVQVSPGFDANRVRIDAFATIAPAACNETEAGRATNRRVETWVSR